MGKEFRIKKGGLKLYDGGGESASATCPWRCCVGGEGRKSRGGAERSACRGWDKRLDKKERKKSERRMRLGLG